MKTQPDKKEALTDFCSFITISWDRDDDPILDIGDFSIYEAYGIIKNALVDLEQEMGSMTMRQNGQRMPSMWDDDDDDIFGEDGNE